MKKLIIYSLLFISCKKGKDVKPIDDISIVKSAYWVPNWATDTLVGVGHNPDGINNYEIMYSYRRGDTSLIRYKDVEYYIWVQCPYANPDLYPNWFKENHSNYTSICIGLTPFNKESAIVSNILNGAFPSTYYNSQYDKWHEQPQKVMINPKKPPFSEWVNAGYYSVEYKNLLP